MLHTAWTFYYSIQKHHIISQQKFQTIFTFCDFITSAIFTTSHLDHYVGGLLQSKFNDGLGLARGGPENMHRVPS